MWPLNVSCRIWLSSACRSCVRRLVRRMRRPMRMVGSMTAGSTTRLISASRQIVAEQHEEQEDGGEELAQQVGQDLRGGHLHFVDVVHDGRHQLAGGVRFEELRALLQDLVEDGVAQVGDAGEAGVADQVVAEVIADALEEEAPAAGRWRPWSRRCCRGTA